MIPSSTTAIAVNVRITANDII